MTKKELEEIKKVMIKELAKLESMNWSKDKDVASSIFPYVIIEAINIIKNSKIIKNPVDYTRTVESSKKLIKDLLK